MALGAVVALRRYPPKRGIREVLVEITGEASYTSTGVTVPATTAGINLNSIIRLLPFPVYPLVDREYLWNNTTGKLAAKVGSTGAEVAGAVNCSADKIVCLITGR